MNIIQLYICVFFAYESSTRCADHDSLCIYTV